MCIKKVKCPSGTIVGHVNEKENVSIASFKGIPYAEAPVGALRWKPPVEKAPFKTEYEAFDYGPAPWQNLNKFEDPMDFEAYPDRIPYDNRSEDCLTLDIWCRDDDLSGKPVLFWVYGGAFIESYTGTGLFDGEDLLSEQNIVLVTVNHREGLMGSMNFESLDPTGEYRYSNNLYILDLIEALRWVNKNIESFGGDPKCITAYGHSSGSCAVSCLTVSYEGRDLFQRSILQSSFYACANRTSLDTARKIGEKVIELAGAKSMDDMLALSPKRLLEIQKELFSIRFEGMESKYFSPVADGRVLPLSGIAEARSGALKDHDLMIGFSDGEYDQMYMRDPDVNHMLESVLSRLPKSMEFTKEKAERFVKNDPDRTQRQGYMDIYNEYNMLCAASLYADAFSRAGNKIYMYCLKWWNDEFHRRPPHGGINAVFFGRESMPSIIPEDFKKKVRSAWVAFMKTGDPNCREIPLWEPYTQDGHKNMMLDLPEWYMASDYKRKDFDMIAPWYAEEFAQAEQ